MADGAGSSITSELLSHLSSMTVPYLFIGAGLSIRYSGSDSWEGLLRTFAEPTGRPYEYYASSADGDLPRVASLIAEPFHELWWTDPAWADSRARNGQHSRLRDSPLKIAISEHVESAVDRLPTTGPLAEELELLRDAVIDGIITTNFDPVLEHVRPDLQTYVGQDELLFSDPQGIGEIYKIHGSCTHPNSLVLTAEDYERFDERNPYLAAKLLTIFVEHPVIFLGYSLSDRNVQRVLVAIARCLTDERIEELRDRLIFVDWKPGSKPSMASTVISVEGFTLPVLNVTVPDFRDVFSVLGRLERRIPARLVRHLRKEVYELVKTSQPSGRLFVEELDPDTDPSEVQVYAGLGAIAKLTTSYVGLERGDLLEDVLDDRGYDASRVVVEALPRLQRRNVAMPVYKYLRGAGQLDARGMIEDADSLSPKVLQRVTDRERLLAGLGQYERRATRALDGLGSFEELVEACSADDVIYYLPFMDERLINPVELRAFLRHHRDGYDGDRQPVASQWAKAVCLYDWLAFGRDG